MPGDSGSRSKSPAYSLSEGRALFRKARKFELPSLIFLSYRQKTKRGGQIAHPPGQIGLNNTKAVLLLMSNLFRLF